MSDRKSKSVLRLISNKFFILLLVFSVAIIFISAAINSNVKKVAVETEGGEELSLEVDKPIEDERGIIEPAEIEEPPEPEEQEISYRLPLAGELQKDFAVDELVWDDTMQDWRTHNGVDIEAEEGAEVVTAAPGRVVETEESEMYGITVRILHDDGIITVYKNLGKTVVKKDERVDEGQMVGTVGNTGAFEIAQKPHLHFEVIENEKNIDPFEFIK